MTCHISETTLKKLYKDNSSVAQIAESLSCSVATAYLYLRQYNIYTPQRDVRCKIPAEELYKYYITEHWSVRSAAQHYGCSMTTVYRNLRLNKINRTHLHSSNYKRDGQVVECRQSGMTLAEIGEKFGLTRERVRKILEVSGIKGRLPKKPKNFVHRPCKCGCNTLVKYPGEYVFGHQFSIQWSEKGVTPELIRQLYDKGATIAELAAKFRVASPTMSRYMDRHGIVRMCGLIKAMSRGTYRRVYPLLYNIQKEELLQLYTAGLTFKEMANKFGCCVGTIEKNLKRYNIPRRPLPVTERRLYIQGASGKV